MFLAASMLGIFVLFFFASSASANLEFCPPGSGASQCAAPVGLGSLRGLSVDYEDNLLYGADRLNNRINVFEEDGDFLFAFGWKVNASVPEEELQSCNTTSGCQAGTAGAGPGQLSAPTKVAVDNTAASPTKHALYVVDEPNFRVQKFDSSGEFVWMVGEGVDKTDGGDLCLKAEGHVCGAGAESEAEGGFKSGISIGVGPGGVLHVLDNLPVGGLKQKHRLQRFESSGALIPPQCILFEGGRARDIAVEAGGSFWVANQGEGEAIRKYDSSCSPIGTAIGEDVENIGIALDVADRLFATQGEGPFRVLTAHEPDGDIISRFAYDSLPLGVRPEGVAIGEAGIFLALREEDFLIDRLDYPLPTPTLPPPGPIAPPSTLEAKDVGATKASLVAEINPEGKPTLVHFEYLTEAEYGGQGESFSGPATKSTTAKPLGTEDFKLEPFEDLAGCPNPAVEAPEPASKCLIPETTYHWRVVATNTDGGGEGTVEGPPFETKSSPELGEVYATAVGTDTARLNGEVNPQGVPASGWFEYVSEEDFQASGFANAVKAPEVDNGQAPLDFGSGEAFATRSTSIFPLASGTTYHYRLVADNPLVEPRAGAAKLLHTFALAGGETCPGNQAARIGLGGLLPDCRAYELVSPLDKAGGDIQPGPRQLGGLAVIEQSSESGERLAYGSRRSFGDAVSAPTTSQYIAERIAGKEWETHSTNPPRGKPLFPVATQSDSELKAVSSDLCQGWLMTYAEWPIEPLPPGWVSGHQNLLRRSDRLCGAEGYEALAPVAPPTGVPGGALFEMELLGVSEEGEHAIFMSNGKLADEGTEGVRQLYESVRGLAPRLVCILPDETPVTGSCTAGSNTISGDPGARSGVISGDGQRIFWSASTTGESKLYVRKGGTETVAVSKAAEEAAGTSSSRFWGAAANGSEAIFSTGNLNGAASLYAFDVDSEASEPTQLIAEGLYGVMGVSNDAQRIYFASSEVLAAGASAGEPNLYLHEAGVGTEFIATLAGADLTAAISAERLGKRNSRISPDGAHAAFVSVAPLTDYDNKAALGGLPTREVYRYDANAKELVCVSCNPSGARPAGAADIAALSTPLHAARVLSEDGRRLYFESADRLVARDTNGRVDVYQWEEEGAGGCDEGDAGFSAAAKGCIELISSGQNLVDSRFVESSPTGHDVFFATLSSLLPQDYGLVDIYDARIGGGLPVPPPLPPLCEGDACQNVPPFPEPPSPASSSYETPPSKPKRRCAKGKRRVNDKGKARCMPKRKPKRRRAAR